jgi:hypothetical protein
MPELLDADSEFVERQQNTLRSRHPCRGVGHPRNGLVAADKGPHVEVHTAFRTDNGVGVRRRIGLAVLSLSLRSPVHPGSHGRIRTHPHAAPI